MTDSNPEDIAKITTVEKTEKVKDRRRVMVGKRLAEISKATKEQKMRQKIEEIEEEKKERSYNFDFKYLYPLTGLIIAEIFLYYSYKQNQREVKTLETTTKEKVNEETPRNVDIKKSPPGRVNTLESFDLNKT